MNLKVALILILLSVLGIQDDPEQYITRQGKASFFSYTKVEDIKAENNQVLSIIDLEKNEIAISMLMRTFVFEKALMQEHFNESYVESDLFPKATFEGKLPDFHRDQDSEQIRIIKGNLTIHGITQPIEIKTTIQNSNEGYIFSGDFKISIEDYDIKIPALLSPNISKNILISFRFDYKPYEV